MNYEEFFPIEEYYINFIQPINPNKYFIGSSGKVVCPCHADVNPSMGIVRRKDSVIVHCFGCNFWGDIVKLHQKVMSRLFKKYLNEEETKKDLCRIFNVDYDSLPADSDEDLSNASKSVREEVALMQAEESFSFYDYKTLVTEGKFKKKKVGYFNQLMIQMTATEKEGE